MIRFSNVGNFYSVTFKTGIGNWEEVFRAQCENEYNSTLRKKQLEEEYKRQVESLCKEMYDQGYKDGRGHQKKKTWFPSWLGFKF